MPRPNGPFSFLRVPAGAALLLMLAMVLPAAAGDKDWPQWRGPLGTGVAPRGNPPVEWSETRNVRWKVPIPGKGHSTPIVWGDRIFVTTAIAHGDSVETGHHDSHGAHDNLAPSQRVKFVVVAVDRRDGKLLWQRTVRDEVPHESMHETGSWASGSMATDGKSLFASFGSRGLYRLSMKGEVLWEKDLGDMQIKHGHGEGSSPVLQGDILIVNWDHQGESFVAALDKLTGKQRWKVTRDEMTSWSTPLVVEHEGRHQVIVAATRRVRAYDLGTGDVIWECGGLSGNVVASPVAADGYVYVGSSYEKRVMLAIRLAGAKGDITGTGAVAWTRDRDTPYVPSPLLYGDSLCFLKHYQGILTCVHAKSGEPMYGPRRLAGIGNVYASLVGAADRVYVSDLDGTTDVIRRGEKYERLSLNQLDDSFSASPAIAGDELFLRGERNLYCIAEDAATQ